MTSRSVSLQDQFLNSVRRAKLPVTIFLMKGVKLHGFITAFDAFSVMLRRDGISQLVYKHSMSTIVPAAMPPDFAPERPDADQAPGGRAVLQDLFLGAAQRGAEPMSVFLVNGVMLQGSVSGFDQFSLLLERGEQAQLVYKHAISTLQPERALRLDAAATVDLAEEERP